MSNNLNNAGQQINREIESARVRLRKALIRTLSYAGEKLVNIARDTSKAGTFKDQSGCLRSSIGYALSYNGKVVSMGNFTTVKGGGEGSVQGKEYAKQLATKHSQGIALYIVAGRDYASYVEKKGFDVLASANLQADNIVTKLLKDLSLEQQNSIH